jgi:formamidopyrimidine-DNA glycosylase
VPELPDVELLDRDVDVSSLHRRVDDVFLGSGLVEDASGTIRRHLRRSELDETGRHGRHLFLHSSGGGRLRHRLAGRSTSPPEHQERVG